MRALVAIAGVLCALVGTAAAYPQYQLSKDQTCASCHLSPVGGGLLGDMGELTAEEESQWGGNPSFLHGAFELPEWLHLGGDARSALGGSDRGAGYGAAIIPMQYELYGQVARGAFSAYATAGITVSDEPGAPEPKGGVAPWFREHWLMWKPKDGGEGLYARVGRFMPVFGLRQAEHVFYNRRYGGSPLYGEAYGANVGWLSPGLEAHGTVFVRDRLVDGIEKGDGAALYIEKRFGNKSVAFEDRYATSANDTKLHIGATGKLWLEGSKLLLQLEAQVVRQNFKVSAGDTRFQLIGNLLATYFVRPGLFVDLGLGHYDEDLHIAKVDRDAADLNVHWFPISHLEMVLMVRYQMIGLGGGGEDASFGLVQAHYRF